MQHETIQEFTHDDLVQIDGHWRVVQRKSTTCGRLYKTKQIPARLMSGMDKLVESAARALGVAVYEGDDSTAKLISRYDGMPPNEYYGPRSPSIRQIQGAPDVQYVADHMPPELVDLLWMCLNEELGAQTNKALTLTQIGEQRGYQSKKQASASGGTQVFDMLAIAAQLRREFLVAERKKKNSESKMEVHPERQKANGK